MEKPAKVLKFVIINNGSNLNKTDRPLINVIAVIEVSECRGPSGVGFQDCVPRGFRCKRLQAPGKYRCICPRRKMINSDGKCVKDPQKKYKRRKSKGKKNGRSKKRTGNRRNKQRNNRDRTTGKRAGNRPKNN